MNTAPANVGDRGVLQCSKSHISDEEAVCQSLLWVTNSSDVIMNEQDWNSDFCIGTITFNALSYQSIQCEIEFDLNNMTLRCLSEAVAFQPQGI